jgi:hypothetical protein
VEAVQVVETTDRAARRDAEDEVGHRRDHPPRRQGTDLTG